MDTEQIVKKYCSGLSHHHYKTKNNDLIKFGEVFIRKSKYKVINEATPSVFLFELPVTVITTIDPFDNGRSGSIVNKNILITIDMQYVKNPYQAKSQVKNRLKSLFRLNKLGGISRNQYRRELRTLLIPLWESVVLNPKVKVAKEKTNGLSK